MEQQDRRSDGTAAHPATGVRKRHLWLFLLSAMLILWVVVTTEIRVVDLRSQGFTDVVIDSERNHAYFPLIGGLFGSVAFIALVRGARRLLGGQSE